VFIPISRRKMFMFSMLLIFQASMINHDSAWILSTIKRSDYTCVKGDEPTSWGSIWDQRQDVKEHSNAEITRWLDQHTLWWINCDSNYANQSYVFIYIVVKLSQYG
jgi:hypothetical protein